MEKILSGREGIDRALGSHILESFLNVTSAQGLKDYLQRPANKRIYFGEGESPKAYRHRLGRQKAVGEMPLPIVALHRKMGHSIEDVMDIHKNMTQKIGLKTPVPDSYIEGALNLVILPVILDYQLQCFAQDRNAIDSFCDLVHSHLLQEKFFLVPYLITVPAVAEVHEGASDQYLIYSEIKGVKELVFEDVSPEKSRETGFQLGVSVNLRVQTRVFMGENARVLDGMLQLNPTEKI